MQLTTLSKLPQRVIVKEIVSSRYPNSGHERPNTWDARCEGSDIVRTTEGHTLKLQSDGGQSPPKPGWVILVNGGSPNEGYRWTLYGISDSCVKTAAQIH